MLPLVIGLQFLLTLGVAYFVATFQVRFRDTQHLLNVVLLLLAVFIIVGRGALTPL